MCSLAQGPAYGTHAARKRLATKLALHCVNTDSSRSTIALRSGRRCSTTEIPYAAIYIDCVHINHHRDIKYMYRMVHIRCAKLHDNTELFEMIVGGLTTCHTQYTWDRSICIFLFNRTTLQVFVTYVTGALYVHHLWFYKHQHDNRVRYKLYVACQRWWFQWRFWFIPSVPGYLRVEEELKPDPWHNPIERNHTGLHLENEVTRRVAS